MRVYEGILSQHELTLIRWMDISPMFRICLLFPVLSCFFFHAAIGFGRAFCKCDSWEILLKIYSHARKKSKSVGMLVLRLRWRVKVVTGLTRRSCSSVNIMQFVTLYVYFTDIFIEQLALVWGILWSSSSSLLFYFYSFVLLLSLFLLLLLFLFLLLFLIISKYVNFISL